MKTDPSKGQQERRTKPISQQEKELTEALDFLVQNLKMHSEEYHHKTDARKVKRYESILEEAISELIARKERDVREGSAVAKEEAVNEISRERLTMSAPITRAHQQAGGVGGVMWCGRRTVVL